MPVNYTGALPDNMLRLDVPQADYIVFEHGSFDYDKEINSVGEKLAKAIADFDFSKTEYAPDASPGRISYFYFDPESFAKRIQPVIKKQAE